MSERDEMFWMLWDNYTPEQKNAALDRYRAEVRTEAAQEIRDASIDYWADVAADLIDPNVDTS